MTFKHITELRKNGQIDEAYQEALRDFESDNDDIWARRTLAWVLYEYLKKDSLSKKWLDFDIHLADIVKLKLPADEKLFLDQLAWQIAKRIKELQEESTRECSSIFNLIKGMKFQPSSGKSYLFRTFHKHRGNWQEYLDFCEWWNFSDFLPEDFEYFTTESKQKVMSLVEQAYIGYANALLSIHDKQRVEAFLPQLETLMQEHPDYKYPLYFKSKLLLCIEKKQEAFDSLLPFVKAKANDFWVWQILGDATSDSAIAFSCYSRALTCPCKPQMLVKIKEQYASMLLKKGMYNEAKTEILQVLETRNFNGWKTTEFLQNVQKEEWFVNASARKSNMEIYKRYSDDAENVVYTNSQTENIIITSINYEKQTASFLTTKQVSGFFRFRSSLKGTPKIGETYVAKFSDLKENRNCQILHITKNNETSLWVNNLADFEGTLKRQEGKSFGIVTGKRQIFVSSQLLKDLHDGDLVKGNAVKSFDKHKNQEGWTALSIQKA